MSGDQLVLGVYNPVPSRIDVTLFWVKLYLMECIAVLGRLEQPADGVEDYCSYLSAALAAEGIHLSSLRVRWAEIGWQASRKEFSAAIRDGQNVFFLLQYTALAWSRRGFALRAISIMKLLRKKGARCAVVFHDPDGYAGTRILDRFRRAVQRYAMRRLVSLSDFAVFTLALDKIPWLPPRAPNVVFIPVGANLPAPERAWTRHPPLGQPAVSVFSLSDNPARAREVRWIAEAVGYAAKKIGPLELVIMGRNSEAGGEELRSQLCGKAVEVKVLGLLPGDEVVQALGNTHALLFARGPISSRRGSAIAGIACGLPVIAQGGSEMASPITEAGVALVPEHSPQDFGPVLARVLSDEKYRTTLTERSRNAQGQFFSWNVIARKYADHLQLAAKSPSQS